MDKEFFNPFAELGNKLGASKEQPSKKPVLTSQTPQKKQSKNKEQMEGPALEDECALFLESMQGLEAKTASVKEDTHYPPVKPTSKPIPAALRLETKNKNPMPEEKTTPKVKQPQPVPTANQTSELESEEAIFAAAMQDARPLEGKGRALVPPVTPKEIKKAEVDYLEEFMSGRFEFALEHTEEFFEGHVMGLDPLLIAKLRAGQLSAESHLDLHGLNAAAAVESLIDFIKLAYTKGQRTVIIVTGRGKNSPGGMSILRQNMQEWLTQEPLKRVVLAFCTAQPKDGGAGAMYVILRKYKKKQGKIRWERTPGVL